MELEKWVAFFDKLADGTKDGRIGWRRLNSPSCDATRSFLTSTGNIKVYLEWEETSDDCDNNPTVYITYDATLPSVELKYQNMGDGSLSVAVKRLYNLVYNSFPNLESSIENFLNNFQ